jgi:pimeloyl-ACP methyl ester carboxylesterase
VLVGSRSLVAVLAGALVAGCASPPPSGPAGTPWTFPPAAPASDAPATDATATRTASPVSVTATPSPGGIGWESCGAGQECGTFEVPLDHDAPDGPTIGIALVRLPATDPAGRIGSLLYNPGGPGASGVQTIQQAGRFIFSEAVQTRFDIVGFDPRGVGASQPVRCLATRPELPGAYPDEPAEMDAWLAAAEEVAAACEANAGALLANVGTRDVARDLDLLRAALGDEGLTYLGMSYGTLIGESYAEQFPENIRAIVLDAPMDPAVDGAGLIRDQALGVEGALERLLAECASDTRCPFGEGSDRGGAFDALMGRFEDGSVDGVTGQVAWNAIALGLMSGQQEALLGALDAAEDGDLSGLAAFGSLAEDEASLDAYDAVACLDMLLDRSPETWERIAQEVEEQAPRTGRFLTYAPGWGSIDCAYWPVPPQREPGPVDAPGAPPILVVGSTGDPATPFAWAEAVTTQIAGSVLLTRDGEGHTSYGRNLCIGQAVDAYLLGLELPSPGTVCADR